jgi:activating signal cointegrator 1
MKALSLWQPWASLIGNGKQYETRSWTTNYRGPIAIHAAKFFPREHRSFCFREPFHSCLIKIGDNWWPPQGVFVAIAELTEIKPTQEIRPLLLRNDLVELAFGNYEDGRYAWKLENIRRILPVIPTRGRQGLWNLDEETISILKRRAE